MNFGENYSKDNLGQRKTYLSSNVMKLVCYQPEVEMLVSETADKLFLEDGILDWTRIENEYNLKECMSDIMEVEKWPKLWSSQSDASCLMPGALEAIWCGELEAKKTSLNLHL